MYLFFHAVLTHWFIAFGTIGNVLLAEILVAAVACLPAISANYLAAFQAFMP